jgi:hypothetical protein
LTRTTPKHKMSSTVPPGEAARFISGSAPDRES